MNNEEDKRCPLCAEELDWTDQQFKPCKCGYQVCVWCWHHIMDMAEKDETEGRCPACRSIYEKDKIVATQTKFERVTNCHANGKNKPPKAKPKTNEVKKDLTNVRVIQRKMAYVIGLPLSLADEDLLQRKQYFGQYGKVTKVSLSRTAGGAIQQFINDSCSVYITYSKEEEAVRCIQSVHGFVLDGRYLRASFGTAKYCHAWLRNMPCNNSSCLYLHYLGADEDSFGKDETAAIHTRNRVQQITGITTNMIRRTGNFLPPPVDDIANTGSVSMEKHLAQNVPPNTIPGSLSSSGGPKKATTFVDIVGKSNISDPEKDGNNSYNWMHMNSYSDVSGASISRDDHSQGSYSDIGQVNVSSSNQLQRDQSSGEFSDDTFREDLIYSDVLGSHDSNSLCRRASSLIPSHSENFRDSTGGHSLLDMGTCNSVETFLGVDSAVHKQEDEASLPMSCANLVLNDSDMVYRSSNSFSNEEIVEHLRRIDDDIVANDVESSAFGAVENSIISNIMSMNLDDETDSHHAPSWNSVNSGQSRFSFAFQDSTPSQGTDFESSFRNFSQLPKQCSAADYDEGNKEQYLCKPQYQAPRSRSLAPPGFSGSSLNTPPGFCACDGAGRFPCSISGSDTSAVNSNLADRAILSFINGTQVSGLNNPPRPTGLDMWGAITPPQIPLENEARLWLLMQQQQQQNTAEQNVRLPHQMVAPQPPSTNQDLSFLGRGGNGLYTSSLMDQSRNITPSSLTEQQKLVGYQQNRVDDVERNQRLGANYLGGYLQGGPSPADVYNRVFGM